MPILLDGGQGIDNFCPIQILLTVIVWVFVIKLINSGLKQIETINRQPA